jgi:hypothetical protein|tara:strand:- start:1669 stop:1887 length:219 start_codon:yes stop_codon:yes gene_type:complete
MSLKEMITQAETQGLPIDPAQAAVSAAAQVSQAIQAAAPPASAMAEGFPPQPAQTRARVLGTVLQDLAAQLG